MTVRPTRETPYLLRVLDYAYRERMASVHKTLAQAQERGLELNKYAFAHSVKVEGLRGRTWNLRKAKNGKGFVWELEQGKETNNAPTTEN